MALIWLIVLYDISMNQTLFMGQTNAFSNCWSGHHKAPEEKAYHNMETQPVFVKENMQNNSYAIYIKIIEKSP